MNTKPTGVLVQASGLRTRGFRCTHGTETHNRGTYSTEMHTESNLPCSSTGSRSPLRHEIRSSHLFGEKLHPRLVKLQKRLIRVTSNCFSSYLSLEEKVMLFSPHRSKVIFKFQIHVLRWLINIQRQPMYLISQQTTKHKSIQQQNLRTSICFTCAVQSVLFSSLYAHFNYHE